MHCWRGNRPRAAAVALAVVAIGVIAAALHPVPSIAAAAQTSPGAPRAVLALWTTAPERNALPRVDGHESVDRLLRLLDAVPGAHPGLMSTAQGRYDRRQALLDISQGSRQPLSLHRPRLLPDLGVEPDGDGVLVRDWAAARARAGSVSTTLRPGLLAASVPGGAGLVSAEELPVDTALVAADTTGRVSTWSSGPASTVASRTAELLVTHRFVVADLPRDADGRAALGALVERRPPGTLLLVAHLPPTPVEGAVVTAPFRFYSLTAFGVAGREGDGSPTSATTRTPGVISTIDVAPTVLRHLGVPVPPSMRGVEIELDGAARTANDLEASRRRWSDVRDSRQSASLQLTASLSVLLLLVLGGLRGLAASLRPWLRVAALAFMWWPVMVLGAAVVTPRTRLAESFLIAGASMAAAAATDAALRWPRGPLAPSAVAMGAYGIDLATGGRLLTRSALGPSILSGNRFYGVSNELEPLLPILLLVGIAAAAGSGRLGSRLTAAYVIAGIGLGVVVGWGRLGADVGGVITVAAGFTAAALVVSRRRVGWRSLAVTLAVPVLALLALVAVDLGVGGDAHLSRNLTRGHSAADLFELVSRRYRLSARVLLRPSNALAVGAAVLAVWCAVRNRRLLFGAVPGPAWTAALAGGLAAGVLGALTNDSGPVLLVNAVGALAAVTMYTQGGQRPAPSHAAPP